MEKPSRDALLTEPLDIFRAFWLELSCSCGQSRKLRVYGLLNWRSDQTMAQVLPRLKCSKCGAVPATCWVCETSIRVRVGLGIEAGWSVLVVP